MTVPPSDLIGRTISHYSVREKIGAGGMGEVYRAEDSHLDRSVAIKILPAEAVVDPGREQRFVQEAKSASALNHPNIIHIYDIDKADGSDFIVMEYVPGKTLDELIGRRGMGIGEALKYAAQVADALAAAHAAGIVHRDLKPANIMVTVKGLVKVLDFGLAKLTEAEPDRDIAATLTARPRTQPGVVMGTSGYMSPEQAEGKTVDARSDIFSFGAVLYEMVSGRRAFEADSAIGTLAAIIHQEPRPLEGIPPELERIIKRCLQKDPGRRFQHMADVKVALDELKEETDSGLAVLPRRGASRRRRLLGVFGVGLGTVVIGVFAWLWMTRAREGPRLRNTSFTQLTDAPGPELYPGLSPDGDAFVYQSRASGNWDIYFQRVGGKTVINLTKDSPEDDTAPAFSPDGARIAFRSERDGGGIFIMGATGESVKRLTDFGYNPAWSPDGNEIACTTASFTDPTNVFTRSGQLFVINVASGDKRAVSGPEDVHEPSWSPHGQRIAYWGRTLGSGNRDLWTVSAKGGKPVRVMNDPFTDWDPVWSPDGRFLYFSSDRDGSMNLWRVPIAERSGRVLGPPEPVTTPAPYSGYISVSRDGRRLLYSQKSESANIYKVDFNPDREVILGPAVPVTQGTQLKNGPNISRDGQWVVFQVSGKQEDLYSVRTGGTGLRQLTDDPAKDRDPVWSPDGRQIAFMSDRGGKFQIWTTLPDGSEPRQVTDEPSGAMGGAWSPDGTQIAYRTTGQAGSPGQLLVVDVTKPWSAQKPEVLAVPSPPGGSFNVLSWSSAGRLALSQNQADGIRSGIFVYEVTSRKLEKISDFGDYPYWLGDGRRLVFTNQGKLYLADSQSRRVRELLSIPPNEIEWPSVSGDDRLIVFRMSITEADIWMATLK